MRKSTTTTGTGQGQGTCIQRYNSRHCLFGHLHQGRYETLVVDGEQGNYFGVVAARDQIRLLQGGYH